MAFTPEQEAKLRALLRPLGNALRGPDRLIDIVIANDRVALLKMIVTSEEARLAQLRQTLPAARAAQDAQLARDEQVLADTKLALDQLTSSSVAFAEVTDLGKVEK